MERFLEQCANYIFAKHRDNLKNIKVVFPNRRAGVFFTSYLQKNLEHPVIGPQNTTIGELVSEYSDLQQADKLKLISLLYEVFRKHTNTLETFDEFYFWGEILLADFNDIDRYLVNAKDLFQNLLDIKEVDQVFDYLTDNQKTAIQHFLGSLSTSGGKEFHQKYLTVWEKLHGIYAEFREELLSRKIAYGGMIDRIVIENLENSPFTFDFEKYYFIGLNALNACEKKFIKNLVNSGKAVFLWDFDDFYLNDRMNVAGRFMRENLLEFPPPADFKLNTTLFNQPKKIKLVAVSSSFGQSQLVPFFLSDTNSKTAPRFDDAAIVLADESLLFSALGAIPQETGAINVTMGYPAKNSVIYGFIMLLVNLLRNTRWNENQEASAYYRYVTDILNHQLLSGWESVKSRDLISTIKTKNRITVQLNEIDFSELHRLIFNVPRNVGDYSNYFLKVLGEIYLKWKNQDPEHKMLTEIIYVIYQVVEKLGDVVKNVKEEYNREISSSVYFRLFSQHLSSVSVPFEGEPLSGIQVMGILETRCLDFENLLILGLNENKWPRTFTAPSFIPHNLRIGFGLPGIDEQDAMYSYYFYRLIQRSKTVYATYNVTKDGIGTGELSRYGHQLWYDSNHQPEKINLDFRYAGDPVEKIIVQGSSKISTLLLERNSEKTPLSPSAINIYLQCSLRFYFRYVAGLPEPEDVRDEIDGMIFGNIFHDVMEALYLPHIGKTLNKQDFEQIRKNKLLIENEIHKKIALNYFMDKDENVSKIKLEGKSVLIYENLKTYISKLLLLDSETAPLTLFGLEQKFTLPLEIVLNGKQQTIDIGGIVDRIDMIGGVTRIVDYKTGNVDALSFKTIEELFEKQIRKPKKEILQALIYSLIFSENTGIQPINPSIYSIQSFFKENFDPSVKMNGKILDINSIKDEFLSQLNNLLSEIYSENNVFEQTRHQEHCNNCSYRSICRR